MYKLILESLVISRSSVSLPRDFANRDNRLPPTGQLPINANANFIPLHILAQGKTATSSC